MNPNDAIQLALDSLNIQSIPFQEESEMDRLITLLLSCECILRGPFALSTQQKSCFEEKLQTIASMHPKSSSISDYPKAIEFWNIVSKMRDDFLSKEKEVNVNLIFEDPDESLDPSVSANLPLFAVCCHSFFRFCFLLPSLAQTSINGGEHYDQSSKRAF